ncbi:Aste57867_10950 [Aphanomyces stellatus]|uniref:Aste57867_10950 protein n=1 Tax=Aphanomyces stellatus TaxID=120398 RepID=A0A485KS39_9STRA|nr:hypothetical protein As57867_010910 [Aphanomyces stellatus]VFT87818.1 Aste57867_10950 [Aphanomyces stellatus]
MSATATTAAAAATTNGVYSWCDAKAAAVHRRPSTPAPTTSAATRRLATTPVKLAAQLHHNRKPKQAMPPRNALKKQQEAMLKTRASVMGLDKSKSTAEATLTYMQQIATAFMEDMPKLL